METNIKTITDDAKRNDENKINTSGTAYWKDLLKYFTFKRKACSIKLNFLILSISSLFLLNGISEL